MEDILAGSIVAIGQALSDRRLSAHEVTGWYLARIEALNHAGPQLNAVRELASGALEAAKRADRELAAGHRRGPLHGIPVLLKDNVLAADMTATAGAAALKGFKPRRDATLVARLRAAGAIVIGKTNLTEFADYVSDVMPSGFSGAGGVVKNPHGVAPYGRGLGSSVGSAAAVAAAVRAGRDRLGDAELHPDAIVRILGLWLQAERRSGQPFGCRSAGAQPGLARADRAIDRRSRAGAVRDRGRRQHRHGIAGDAARFAGIAAAARSRHHPDRCAAAGDGGPAGFRRCDGARLRPCCRRLSKAGVAIVDPCDLPSAEQLQDVRSSVFRTEFKAALNAFLRGHDHPCGINSLAALIRWNDAHPDAIPHGQSLLLAAEATTGLDDPQYRADRARDIVLSRTAGIDAAIAASAR